MPPPQEEEEEMAVAEEVEVEEEEDEEEVEYEEVTEDEEEEEEEEEAEEKEEKGEQNPNPNPIPKPKSKPSVIESVANLQALHGALSDFLVHYDCLQQTLDSINSGLEGYSDGIKPTKIEAEAAPADEKQYSQLEFICRSNGAKALRKYIIANFGEIDRLRREVPEALKLSPVPERLVLEAKGKFYSQGSKAYERGDKTLIDTRRAGILLLEFYVIAGCPVAAAAENWVLESVKKNATDAALSWVSRLISEGGIESASAVDALGLALLLAGFGIPPVFRAKDLYNLLRLSNLKKKGEVFRRSPILVRKMPDVIRDLVAKDMYIEAVDLVCAFGLEEKFPPLPLLSSFVTKTCEGGVEDRRGGQCSLRSLKEANEKQLAALKSVVKCLEAHKLDAAELANLKIDQKIAKCEKEILKGEQKLREKNSKRKFEDVDPLKKQDSPAKLRRPPSTEALHGPLLHSVRQTQHQGITPISDSRYAYNGYVANNLPVAHGLVDRNGVGLLPRNVHETAGRWHGNAVYQDSAGHGLLGTPYSSGHDYTRYSASAGQNIYEPPVSGQNVYHLSGSGQNIHHPSASGHNVYYASASGQDTYQPPASMQSFYQAPASSLATGVGNPYQYADAVSEQVLSNYTATNSAVPAPGTAINPSHHSSHGG